MRSITINMPDSLDLKTFDVAIYIAAKMYEDGILSSGQAASIADISKRTFVEIMGRYGVSVFSESVTDLENDIANA